MCQRCFCFCDSPVEQFDISNILSFCTQTAERRAVQALKGDQSQSAPSERFTLLNVRIGAVTQRLVTVCSLCNNVCSVSDRQHLAQRGGLFTLFDLEHVKRLPLKFEYFYHSVIKKQLYKTPKCTNYNFFVKGLSHSMPI